jgi:hypothetical protein
MPENITKNSNCPQARKIWNVIRRADGGGGVEGAAETTQTRTITQGRSFYGVLLPLLFRN